MSISKTRPALGSILYFCLAFSLGLYFSFAAIQGDFGLFKRVQIDSETQQLRIDLAALESQVAWLQNKTHRLSDEYLDLDLLDEQARSVLGMIRADEIVIR